MSKSKVPNNAKLVFGGIIFNVYQWKEKMFDNSFSTFEAVIRKPSVQIIVVTENNKLIILEEKQPFVGKFFGLVGGQVENSETIIQSVKKELLEETGMRYLKLKLWKKIKNDSKIIWDTYYFIANGCKIIQKPTPEVGEKIKMIECGFEKFIRYTQKKSFRNKEFSNIIFKMIHTKNELKEFKKKLFE